MYSVCIASPCLFNHEQGVRWNFNDELPLTSPILQFSCSSSLKQSCLPDPDSVLQNDQCSHVLLSNMPYTYYIFTIFVRLAGRTFWLRLTSVARYFFGYRTIMRSLAENKSRIGHSTCPRLQICMAICGIKKCRFLPSFRDLLLFLIF